MKLRVLIVDDHQMFREALGLILEQDPGIEVVAQASDGLEALDKARETHPDLVCMDLNMPRLNGIEATRRLIAEHPGIKVIALSAYSDQEYVLALREAGALGYVVKTEAAEELLRAVQAVARDEVYRCPVSAQAVSEVFPSHRESAPPLDSSNGDKSS